jgi:hypothetical protein
MELTKFLAALAVYLPIVYGAPTTAADSLHPAILAAMKRDLGLDAEQAHVRVARELKATEVIEQVRTLAGNSFGGAWLVDGELNVAVTDEALKSELAAAGATPLVVSTPLSKLEEAKKALDKIDIEQALGKRSGENGIAAYYVDVAANKLILEALSGSAAQAAELAKQVGLVESEFEVRTVSGLPTTFATVRGGDAYLINRSARCSVGFSVTTGFVSAVGASICRSGSTTGVHCGTVRALGATVSYSQGRVTGLTQTNVCAEPGDSGGSFYSGAQAQGVTSGGSGDCSSGGTTYFQPVNEILSAYGLTLARS